MGVVMIDVNTYVALAQNDSIDNAEQYRLSNSPKKLFKFMPFYDSGNLAVNKRNIETIEENKIWASKYSTLNDPFEFKSIYLDEDKIRKSGNSVETFEKYLDYINNSFLVVSFSAEGNIHPLNNMPMWAYYSNNHHGICIEYEVVNPIILYPIIYETTRNQIASIIGNFVYLATAAAKGEIPPDDADLKLYQFLMINNLCRKHKSWQHENEYRILVPNVDKILHGKRVLLNQIGVKIKAIYLGRDCNTRNKKNLYHTSQKLGIDIFQMDIKNKSNDFEMEYKPYMKN